MKIWAFLHLWLYEQMEKLAGLNPVENYDTFSVRIRVQLRKNVLLNISLLYITKNIFFVSIYLET